MVALLVLGTIQSISKIRKREGDSDGNTNEKLVVIGTFSFLVVIFCISEFPSGIMSVGPKNSR